LTDALLDPDVDFGIRRRIPRLLARCGSQRGVEGLIQGLHDSRFEVRFQCGRALDYLRQHHERLEFRAHDIYAAVERELSVSKTIWRSWRILDKRDTTDQYNFLDDRLKERADQSLEHVFSLLAVVLPREPLMAAFRGLHEDDRIFRGLALEYLETVLPPNLRDRLWVILEETPAQTRPADPAEEQALLDSLLRTDARLELKLKQQSQSGD
jgi:AAA family ATP:ADP antiporter